MEIYLTDSTEKPWEKRPKHGVRPEPDRQTFRNSLDEEKGRYARSGEYSYATSQRQSQHRAIQDSFSQARVSKSGASGSNSNKTRQREGSQPINSRQALDRLKQMSPPKKKMSTWKRVLAGVGIIIALVLCVGVGYAAWYSGQLNSRLALEDSQASEVDGVLSPNSAGDPFYMLVLGSDSREGSGTSDKEAESGDNQRSDVMILMRIDPSEKKITMVSIPRDTRYTLPDGSVVKINEAYNYGGAAASIEAVSKVTGVPISHYAEIHFSEFQELVDKLGGITVDVPIDVSYEDALSGETVTVEKGLQTLNGQQAQIFARARHEYGTGQDENRQSSVRLIMAAMIGKILDRPLYELPDTMLDVATCVGTDLHTDDIVSLALAFAGSSAEMTMYSCTGPSSGDFDETAGGIWLCYENPEGWAKLMAVVDSGENPSGLDVEGTAITPVSAESFG